MAMTLTSDTFKDGDYLGAHQVLSENFGFGCAGGNISPHLRWEGAPADTKSFAVTCYDPDAPTGSGFWHWIVVNIPATVNELPLGAGDPASGKLPDGVLNIRNDTSQPGYAGPCPPEGDHPHRYLFTVFAVATETLPVSAESTAAVVGFNLHFTTLDKATLMGLYRR
jgi:Raf kinase inhibitor-like YbhB/YbcL family protein